MEGTIGEIRMFAGNFAPRSWAFCEGQLLPVAQNTALFSIIGITYGGDGRTTFALPDLRGRVPIGSGSGPGLSTYREGQKTGVETTTLTSRNLPPHHHMVTVDGTTNVLNAAVSIPTINDEATLDESDGNVLAVASSNNSVTTNIYGPSNAIDSNLAPFRASVTGNINTQNTGAGQSFNNLQPSLATYFIICLQGIYPSRS